MVRLDVRPRSRRQHRKCRTLIPLALAPDARNRCNGGPLQRESVFGLWIFLAGKFEKCASEDEAPVAQRPLADRGARNMTHMHGQSADAIRRGERNPLRLPAVRKRRWSTAYPLSEFLGQGAA
jgi:hypothetical protein